MCYVRAALRMAQSGSTVSFQVAKQAALYNGLATWLYQPSPDISQNQRLPRQGMHQSDLSLQHPAHFRQPQPDRQPLTNGHLEYGKPFPIPLVKLFLKLATPRLSVVPLWILLPLWILQDNSMCTDCNSAVDPREIVELKISGRLESHCKR